MRACFALLALSLVACDGGNGGSCVIDSDCSSFLDVCIEGTCQPAGTLPESGTPERDAGGGGMDAGGPTDAGEPMDAEPMDAGEPVDAEPMDAMATDGMVDVDAAVPVCDTPGTSWSITFVSAPASCGDAMVGSAVSITAIDGMACNFNATSPGSPALSGSFVLDESGMVLGMMSPGSAAVMTCSGTYNPSAPQFTIICGSCVMNLGPL